MMGYRGVVRGTPVGTRMRAALSMGLVAAMVAVLLPTGAAAATVGTDTPDSTWQTGGKSASDYTGSRVNSIAVTADRYFLGGNFTNVRPPGNTFGTGNVVRNHLAAFDASGTLVTTWNPNANGNVNAVAVDPATGTVFVGGAFSSIGGQAHSRLAAIDPVTGLARSWNPAPNAEVTALLVANGRLYVGGNFTTISGASRTRFAAFDLPSLALNGTWRPTADKTVNSLAVTDGSSTVLAGGFFTAISGNGAEQHLVALDAASGAIKPLAYHPLYYIEGITPTATQVFVAEGGPGGKVQALSWPAGSLQWTAQFDGDMQALVQRDGTVYAGGHQLAYCVGGTGAGAPFVCDNPTTRRKFAALDAATGALTTWNPDSNGPLGVFAMEATPTGIVAGGEFSIVHGRRQQGFARFTFGTTTSDQPPSTPTNLTGSASSDGTAVHLTWDASTDDHGVDHYAIYRADAGSSALGTASTTAYDDTALTPGASYQYRVQAVDTVGNLSPLSAPFSITMPGGVVPPPSFTDDFESGTLAAWDNTTGIAVEPSVGFGGSQGARAHPSGTAAYAQKQLSAASGTVALQDHFDIASQGANYIDLIKFRSSGTVVASLSVDRTDHLLLRIPATGVTISSATVAGLGVWHQVSLKVTVGSSGTSEVWLDGVQVMDLSVTSNFGNGQISSVQIGDSSSRTYDIVYDDVAVTS